MAKKKPLTRRHLKPGAKEKLTKDMPDFYAKMGSRGGDNTLRNNGPLFFSRIAHLAHQKRRENAAARELEGIYNEGIRRKKTPIVFEVDPAVPMLTAPLAIPKGMSASKATKDRDVQVLFASGGRAIVSPGKSLRKRLENDARAAR
jgi:hypothetical protein